jgi:hypothetical protein
MSSLTMTGDIDNGGNYLLNDQTTTNMMSKGTVYRFDGVDDVITFATPFAIGDGDFAVFADVYTTDLSGTQHIIIGGNHSFNLSIRPTTGFLRATKTSAIDLTASTGAVSANTWVSIGYVKSGAVGTYYINGLPAGTTTDVQDYSATCTTLGVTTASPEAFAEFAYSNFAPTAAEVKDLISGNIPFKWQYGSTLSDAWINGAGAYAYETFTTSGQTVTQAVNSANFAQMAFNHGAVEVGQQFRIGYDLTLTSGTAPTFDIRASDALGTSLVSDSSVLTAGTGQSNTITISTAGAAGWISLWLASGVASDFALANVTIVQIGAVALYTQDSISETTWYDKANGNDGAVTGAEVLNPPGVTPLLAMHTNTIRLQPGATAGTNINCTDLDKGNWGQEAVTDTTNLAKSGTGGSFSLNAGGTILTLSIAKEVSGVSGYGIGIHDINSSSTSEVYFLYVTVSAGNLAISMFKRGSGSEIDLTTIMDAGDLCDFWVQYVTAT